jgi:hypothetical protein
MKTAMVPVRFSQETIAAVRRFASQGGVTVSTWIRRLLGKELQRRQPPTTSPALAPLRDIRLNYSAPPRTETVPTVEPDLRLLTS